MKLWLFLALFFAIMAALGVAWVFLLIFVANEFGFLGLVALLMCGALGTYVCEHYPKGGTQ